MSNILSIDIPEEMKREIKKQQEKDDAKFKTMMNKLKSNKINNFKGGRFVSSIFYYRKD